MITFHAVDSITIMSAIELIEQHNWHLTQVAQEQKSEAPTTAHLILKALRNALNEFKLNKDLQECLTHNKP